MLNKNGKALLKINNSYQKVAVKMKDTTGGETNFSVSENMLGQFMSSLGLYVGSGTNEPTLDDYCLQNEINTLSVISRSGTNTSDSASYTQNYIGSFSATFKNNTQNDITVSEIGIIGETTSYAKKAMIARNVITPQTIGVGKTYTFSLTIG